VYIRVYCASGAEGGGFESRICQVENDAKSLQHNDLAKLK